VRPLFVIVLLLGCEKPCPLVCQNDQDCVQQSVLPGSYCLNNTACLQDCYRCNGGNCVDTFHNCGSCGHACDAGVCSLGTCTTACASNETNCGGSCYDVAKDRTNCGTCGHTCARNQTCVDGGCTDAICG
jgi:hypothetical protein